MLTGHGPRRPATGPPATPAHRGRGWRGWPFGRAAACGCPARRRPTARRRPGTQLATVGTRHRKHRPSHYDVRRARPMLRRLFARPGTYLLVELDDTAETEHLIQIAL